MKYFWELELVIHEEPINICTCWNLQQSNVLWSNIILNLVKTNPISWELLRLVKLSPSSLFILISISVECNLLATKDVSLHERIKKYNALQIRYGSSHKSELYHYSTRFWTKIPSTILICHDESIFHVKLDGFLPPFLLF